jgi:hypothetical protein
MLATGTLDDLYSKGLKLNKNIDIAVISHLEPASEPILEKS